MPRLTISHLSACFVPALHPASLPCLYTLPTLPIPPLPLTHTAYPAYTQTLPLLDDNRQGKPIPYPYSMAHHRQFLDAMHKSAEGGMSRDARPLLADTCARFADAAEVDKVFGIQH